MGKTDDELSKKQHIEISDGAAVNHGHTDAISYEEAIYRLETVAERQNAAQERSKPDRTPIVETTAGEKLSLDDSSTANVAVVSVVDAVGLISVHTIHTSSPTPPYDTSAMDGFAICSSLTENASTANPAKFQLTDAVNGLSENPGKDRMRDPVCVEIMCGSRFPETSYPHLDAVARLEDVELVTDSCESGPNQQRYILVSTPVMSNQYRRSIGSDFRINQVILWAGEIIRPKHVMALAAVGIGKVEVVTENKRAPSDSDGFQFRAAVLSVGLDHRDITQFKYSTKAGRENIQTPSDSTGPYLTSALKYTGLCPDADYLGIVPNDEEKISTRMSHALEANELDVLVTCGGVTMGRSDLVRRVIEQQFGGKIVFHGVKVQPGFSILFATCVPDIKTQNKTKRKEERVVSFFGLPDNSIAAAACLRFFVIPYLTMLKWRCIERPSAWAKVVPERMPDPSASPQSNSDQSENTLSCSRNKTAHLTVFWLGVRSKYDKISEDDQVEYNVLVLADQASHKIQNLLVANCWAICPEGTDLDDHEKIAVTSLL